MRATRPGPAVKFRPRIIETLALARDLGITAFRVSQVIGLMNLATEILDYC